MQLATSERQAQAEQQLWKKNNFYDLKNQVTLPKQAQREITKVIEESYDTIKKINNREVQIMIQRNSVRNIEEKTFKRGSYLTMDSLTIQKYVQFSIMSEIARFVYNMLTNLIQIEAQIDPITHKLIKINQVPVIEIVTKILKCQNIWEQFDMVINIYDDDIEKRGLLAEFIYTVLSKMFQHATQLGYAISIPQFQKAIFNERVLDYMAADDVAQIQTEAFEYNRQKNTRMKFYVDIPKYYQGKFLELLKKKRQSYTKKEKLHFWSLLSPQKYPDMNQMIQKQISGQLQTITPRALKQKQATELKQLISQINDDSGFKGEAQKKKAANQVIKNKKYMSRIKRS